MKRSVFILCALLTGLTLSSLTMADDRRDERRDGDRRHDYGRDYRDHRGYRPLPYDRNRHYRRHDYRRHHYEYRGHWRSWYDFDDYVRRNPSLRRHGHYFHDGMHLMFRTCPPDSGMCLFFSIGR